VDQPEYGTNHSYLADFIQISLAPKLVDYREIVNLYKSGGLAAGQIARRLGISKSFVLSKLTSEKIDMSKTIGRSGNPENFRRSVPPFGFKIVDGRLVSNREELRICRLVVEQIKRQGLSLRAVAKELNRRGLKNRNRKLWGHQSVIQIYNRWKDKI
jgi:transposase